MCLRKKLLTFIIYFILRAGKYLLRHCCHIKQRKHQREGEREREIMQHPSDALYCEHEQINKIIGFAHKIKKKKY